MGVVEEETYHGGLPAAGRHRGPRGVRRERKQERIHRRDALRLRSGSPLRCDRERREEAEEAKEDWVGEGLAPSRRAQRRRRWRWKRRSRTFWRKSASQWRGCRAVRWGRGP